MKKFAGAVDRGLHYVLEQYMGEIVWALLILISVVIRLLFIPSMQSDDYVDFLWPWVAAYRGHPVAECLRMEVGNYFVPYNLFLIFVSRLSIEPYVPIALFSCAADYLMALAVYRLVVVCMRGRALRQAQGPLAMRAAVLTMLMPFVFLNSALWKQCDSVYVCFMLWAMVLLFEDKPNRSFVLLGIALSFKLQTIFVFPFFFYYYVVKKNHSILHWLWVPAVYFLAGVPALAAGKSFSDVFQAYKGQIQDPGGIVRNLPNVYYLGLPAEDVAKRPAVCFAIAVVMVVFYFLWKRGVMRDGAEDAGPSTGSGTARTYQRSADGVLVAAFFIWTCIMFLPGMHERYDYPVTLLITVYALMSRRPGMVVCAIVLQLIDVMDYSYFLFYWSLIEPSKLTIPFIAAYLWCGYEVFRREKESAG